MEVPSVEEDSRRAAEEGTPSGVPVVLDRLLEDRAVVVDCQGKVVDCQGKAGELDTAPENLRRRKEEAVVACYPCCDPDADTRVVNTWLETGLLLSLC